MYNYDHCTDEQSRILSLTPQYFLTPKEQVNFHFMMQNRCVLKSPDFMSAFEEKLLDEKHDRVMRAAPWLESIKLDDTYIPLKTYDKSEIGVSIFQDIIRDKNHTPFVIKGLVSDSNAVQNWSHEYLLENFKDVSIVASNESSGGKDIRKMSLSDIVRSQIDRTCRNSYYINNSAELFNNYPNLIDEVGPDRILDLFKGLCINSFNQMFVGNLRTWGTNWHMGNDISCALMISGKKRWLFLDPRLGYILRPMLDGANGMLTKTDVRQDINFHKTHNPLYAYAPKLSIELEPGDVLFFTKYWAHSVVNVTPFQIMVNMRMTEADLDTLTKEESIPNLLPMYENIINSDPGYIKFKYNIFKYLGKKEKSIGDDTYFSAYNTVTSALNKRDE